MIETGLLAAAFAAGAWLGGWWTVAVIAAVWAWWRRGAPWRAGLAAGAAWAGLLGLTIPWAALGRLAPRLGGVFGLPGWAMLALTPGFALLLAWSAARVAGAAARSERSAQGKR
jgi:hypothetical protein